MPSKIDQADAISDLVRESVAAVDRMAPEAVRAVLPALRDAREELQGDLRAWLSKVDNSERFTTYQMARAVHALDSAIDAASKTAPAIEKGLRAGRHATAPIAIKNIDKEIVRLGAIFGEKLAIPQIDTAAVIARGDRLLWKQHETSAKRYAGELGEDVRHQLAVGVAKGETIGQTVNRLRRLDGWKRAAEGIDPGHHAAEIADGFFNRWRYKADRLVRTEVMHAYNVQHHIGIVEANDERPEGEDPWLERWDASADVVTCAICKGLDGRVKAIGGVFKFEGLTFAAPPAHPHCRCVLIAWLARWGGIKGEIPAVSRTGRDVKPAKLRPPPERKPEAPPAEETPAAVKIRAPRAPGPNASIEEHAYHHVRAIESLALEHPQLAPLAAAARDKAAERIAMTQAQVAELKALHVKARKEAKALEKSAAKAPPKQSLPKESKSAKLQEMPKPTPPAAKEHPIKIEEVPAGIFVEQKTPFGKVWAIGSTREEALAKFAVEKKQREDEAARKAKAKAEIAQRKADKAAGIKPVRREWDPANPHTLPEGAQIGSLRRHGLVERDPATKRFVLNARGIAHFSQLATKKAKKAAGEGFAHCQICERKLAVVNGKISLHGYNRPGWGFIVGACRGSQQLPWELSCDTLRTWIAELRQMLAKNEAALDRIEARESFMIKEYVLDERGQRIYERVGTGSQKQTIAKTKLVEVTESDTRFASAKAEERRQLTAQIAMLTGEISRQSARLATWHPTSL